MLGALRKMFIPKPPEAVQVSYIALVAAARNPFFYTALQVPDTLDGRFELIVLHLFLLEHRLIEGSGAQEQAFAQYLSEAFFYDMDCSLRELGVADTGVSKRIRKMGKSYHGSLQAYAAGLTDPKLLRAALARNLYGTVQEGDVAVLDRLALYIEKVTVDLANTDTALIMEGAYRWPDVAVVVAD